MHLAIIHENIFIALELILLLPKEVLDIQNNLYQVSFTNGSFLGFFFLTSNLKKRDFLITTPLNVEALAFVFISLCFQRIVLPFYVQSVPLPGTSLWVVRVLAHVESLNRNSPPLPRVEIEAQGPCGVYPYVEVGGGVCSSPPKRS